MQFIKFLVCSLQTDGFRYRANYQFITEIDRANVYFANILSQTSSIIQAKSFFPKWVIQHRAFGHENPNGGKFDRQYFSGLARFCKRSGSGSIVARGSSSIPLAIGFLANGLRRIFLTLVLQRVFASRDTKALLVLLAPCGFSIRNNRDRIFEHKSLSIYVHFRRILDG